MDSYGFAKGWRRALRETEDPANCLYRRVGRVSRAKRAVTRQRIYRQPLPEQLAVADRVLARHTVSQTFR